MNYWYERLCRGGRGKNERFSVDLPIGTICTVGVGGAGAGGGDWYWLKNNEKKNAMARNPNKPPYGIPLMSEIAKIPSNGLSIVSTFSGCGGSCLGFKMAGYRVLWANEFVPAARDTYRINYPSVRLDGRDIRKIKPEEILEEIGLRAGNIDVLEGSPPCASFSTAGKRDAGWGQVRKYSDVEQRTDDLFFEYVRLLRGLKPKAFVAENVSGLVKGVAKGYFVEIIRALRASGYRVRARLLDAKWLGVPQSRQRIFFVGVRDDLGLDVVFPRPLPYYYSIREALSIENQFGIIDVDASMERFATGDEWERIGPNGQSEKYFQLVRPDVEQACPTVTAGGGNASLASVAHPTEKRKFYIAELQRLCGFPDDFVLIGSYAQRWERLGRSVPPPMMRAVAERLRDEIFARV